MPKSLRTRPASRHPLGHIAALGFSLAVVSAAPAHATICGPELWCGEWYIGLALHSTELGGGLWQYDYAVHLDYYPYMAPDTPDGGYPTAYTFASLVLPYFDDAALTDLKVGSNFTEKLTLTVTDQA